MATQHRADAFHAEAGTSTGGELPDSTAPLRLEARLNGRDCSIPMHDELGIHYSAARAGSKLISSTGGFDAKLMQTTWLTVRVRLTGCADSFGAQRRITGLAGEFLQMAMDASPDGSPPCCIPGLRVRRHNQSELDVELYIENASLPGRLCLEAAARAIAQPLAHLADCRSAPNIDVTVTEVAQVRVICRVDIAEMADSYTGRCGAPDAAAVLVRSGIDAILRRFGADSHQPLLAAQHNDHLLAASTAAALALGLEPRIIELGARTHAARWGSCESLAKWRRRGRELLGQLQIPLEFGRHDPTTVLERAGELVSEGQSVSDLFLQVAGVGLCSSLGFLQKELLSLSPMRRRHLRPPPLLPSSERAIRNAAVEKARSESGVRPAIRASGGACLSSTG